MFTKYKIRRYNFKLLIMVIALAVIGIFAVGSAEPALQNRQIGGFILGVVLMLVLSLFDYSAILNLYWVMYVVNIALLLAVIFLGEDANGAQRWLKIAGIQFQPSELAKILIILFLAQFIKKHYKKFNTFKMIFLCCILFAVPTALVLKQPDLSTTIVLCLVFVTVMFTAGIHYKVILGVFAVIVPVAIIFVYLVMQPDQTILSDYQKGRITDFLNKESSVNEGGYQQYYSEMAIGSGQLYGKGYKNNQISSVKNADFIAEQQTDFIFAVIGEEFGFLLISHRAKDISGTIIAAGAGVQLGLQGFINIGVVTYILPNTGLPLPFVSYGLTSLVCSFIEIGFVLNVGLQCKEK